MEVFSVNEFGLRRRRDQQLGKSVSTLPNSLLTRLNLQTGLGSPNLKRC